MKIEDITLKFQRYIARALGACELTIRQVLKYLSQEEYQSLHSEIDNEA